MDGVDAPRVLIRARVAVFVFTFLLIASVGLLAMPVAAEPSDFLDPTTIPKWVNELTGPPPVYVPTEDTDSEGNLFHKYTVTMSSFAQQILPPPLPMTPVWGYGGQAADALTGEPLGVVANAPGPTFNATRGIPTQVTWVNQITSDHMFDVDPTLHWANPNDMAMPEYPFEEPFNEAQSPVPLTPHLHGGEVSSLYDGTPESWFTSTGIHGSAYSTVYDAGSDSAVYYYPNMQPPTTLWYHDHALGITRLNVASGLAGFYLLRDPADTVAHLLPKGKYEMPLVIQDRIFKADGSFFFPNDGINPDIHPYWQPEFFGNTIMVNGKVWPKMYVDQGQYRLRLLDGSNARFYTLSFVIKGATAGPRLPFVQIGSDGGYLRTALRMDRLTIAPGERADILIDFSSLAPGTTIFLTNYAKAPFPRGETADPRTTSQIIQLIVTDQAGFVPTQPLPTELNPTLLGSYPSLPTPTTQRTLMLFEEEGEEGPLGVFLNGMTWDAEVTEMPHIATTEEWIIANPTADTHPIHLHLVQFQVVSRQSIDTRKYLEDWIALNGEPPLAHDQVPTELPIGPYLRGRPMPADPNEQGWKDTVRMNPGQVTIIRVRFTSLDGSPYPFDATFGPGYVWHCHILEHEDNEMMRPYEVVA